MVSSTPMEAALRGIERLLREGTQAGLSDDRLLDRFLAGATTRRSPPWWPGTGRWSSGRLRDVLRDPGRAEDAFQATFLTLARRAGSIRGGDAVGAWLHRVAHRAALRLDAREARRRSEERAAAVASARRVGPDAPGGPERDEIRRAIHAEVERLPERYRRPVVLCLMEGVTQPEAAARLGISEGSIRGRLGRARARLRDGLTRRGLATAALPALVAPAIPPSWVEAAVAAARVAVDHHGAIGRGDLRRVEARGRALGRRGAHPGRGPGTPIDAAVTGPAVAPRPKPAPVVTDAAKPNEGPPVVFRGRVLDPSGRPVAGARLYLPHHSTDRRPPRAVRARRLLSLRGARRGGPQGVRAGQRQRLVHGVDRRPGRRIRRGLGEHPDPAGGWQFARRRVGLCPGPPPCRGSADPRPGRRHPGAAGGRGEPRDRLARRAGRREMGAGRGRAPEPCRDPVRRPLCERRERHQGLRDRHPDPAGHDRFRGPIPPRGSRPRSGADPRRRRPGDRRDAGRRPQSRRRRRVHPGPPARFPHKPMPDGYTPEMRWQWRANSEGLRIYGPTPTIEVDPARTVAGTVRAGDTGAPLDAISIYALSREQMGGGNARTDARGRYRAARYDNEPEFWVRADTEWSPGRSTSRPSGRSTAGARSGRSSPT